MSDVMVFFAYDAENDAEGLDYDAWQKGHRDDVYVRIGDEYFRLAVYDTVTLMQDFQAHIKRYGFYLPDPNMILVPEVTKQQIDAAIQGIYKKSFFFQKLKSVEDEVVARLRMQSPNS